MWWIISYFIIGFIIGNLFYFWNIDSDIPAFLTGLVWPISIIVLLVLILSSLFQDLLNKIAKLWQQK